MTPNQPHAPQQKTDVDHWPAVQSMIEADIGSMPELVLRFAVVFLGAIFMTLASGRYEIAIWLTAFLLANGYYSWLLYRARRPISTPRYNGLILLFAISVTLYTTCAVYLFVLHTTAFMTIAIAALVAQSLFNLSRHRQSGFVAFYDTAIVALAGLYFGMSQLSATSGDAAEEMIIVVSTLGVCSYYVIAQIRKIQIHNALQASRLEAVQTQKMRAVGQLTAGVAHEFNNLLTVIRGNVELAQLSDGTDDYQNRLTDAITAADRADALTSQLLSLSRKARLEAIAIDLAGFWDGFQAITPRITPATITFDIHAAPELEQLYCDINQFEVALINLVINARDAMAGRGSIWMTSRRATLHDQAMLKLDKDKRAAFGVIEVRDNGPGISSGDIQHVVEPFYTTKGVGQGTGLGLPMVKGFCEQSGGSFSIESSPNGTIVLLALPIARP